MSSLLKNSAFYSIGSLLPTVGSFFLLPLYTGELDTAGYGTLNTVQVLSGVLIIIFSLALERSLYRLFGDCRTEKNQSLLISTLFYSVVSITLVSFAIFLIFPQILSSLLGSIQFYPIILLGLIGVVIKSLYIVPNTLLIVRQKGNIVLILGVIEFILSNLFILYFLLHRHEGVAGYLKGQLIGSFVVLVPYFLTFRNLLILKFDLKVLRGAMKYSLPLIPALFSAWIMNLSDRIFIERMLDLDAVGIYSLGYKIAMLIYIVSDAFYKAYNPYYLNIAATESAGNAISKLKQTNTLYVDVVLFGTFSVILVSKELLHLLFSESFQGAWLITIVVCASLFVGRSSGIFYLSIQQGRKTSHIMFANMIGAGLNIVLNLVLIPVMGILGAAVATLITYCVIFFVTHYYSKKSDFFVSFSVIKVLRNLLIYSCLVILSTIISIPVWDSLVIKVAVILAAMALLIFRWKSSFVELWK